MGSAGPVALVVGLVVLWAVFSLLEARFGTLPRAPVWHRSRLTDLSFWFFTPLVTRAVTRAAAVVVLVGLAAMAGFGHDPAGLLTRIQARSPIARLPTWAQLGLGLLSADFIAYWSHRLFHGRRLWRFHAVHHSATAIDWLSATRVHPVNDVVSRVLTAAPLLLLGFDPAVFAAVTPIVGLYAIFVHANLPWDFGPLRYLLATPRFHRWHHSAEAEATDKNFAGLFPIFDVLFGTFYMPKGIEPRVFGVADQLPEGLMGQLAYPFRRAG